MRPASSSLVIVWNACSCSCSCIFASIYPMCCKCGRDSHVSILWCGWGVDWSCAIDGDRPLAATGALEVDSYFCFHISYTFCFWFCLFFSYFLLLFFKRRSIFGIRTDTICPCHIQPVERCRVHLLGSSWLYVCVWWRYRWDKSSKLNVLRNISRLAKHFTIPKHNFHWYVTLLKSRYSHKMQMPLIANAILRCNCIHVIDRNRNRIPFELVSLKIAPVCRVTIAMTFLAMRSKRYTLSCSVIVVRSLFF